MPDSVYTPPSLLTVKMQAAYAANTEEAAVRFNAMYEHALPGLPINTIADAAGVLDVVILALNTAGHADDGPHAETDLILLERVRDYLDALRAH